MTDQRDALRAVLLESVDAIPVAFADDWTEYLDGTVVAELRAQLRAALVNGLSPEALYEVLFHVGGYAGYGIAIDALAALADVLEPEPVAPIPAERRDPPTNQRAHRTERAEVVLGALLHDRATRTRAQPYAFAPEWRQWLNATCFGHCWDRPHLTLVDRSRITMAIVMALGQETPLRSHIGVACTLGIPQAEIGEQIMHLSIYCGFSAGVVAMQIADEVFAQAEGRAPVQLIIASPVPTGEPKS
jgi:4-carboxymuconolactone decarboxylase